MPAPRLQDKVKVPFYHSLRAESAAMGETNDCAVVAVAAVTGVPYRTVHELMEKNGRKRRGGTWPMTTRKVLDELGFKVEPVPASHFINQYPSRWNATCITTHQPARCNRAWNDGSKYLLHCRGHILAVVDGQNVDWSRGRSMRVMAVERVTPK